MKTQLWFCRTCQALGVIRYREGCEGSEPDKGRDLGDRLRVDHASWSSECRNAEIVPISVSTDELTAAAKDAVLVIQEIRI